MTPYNEFFVMDNDGFICRVYSRNVQGQVQACACLRCAWRRPRRPPRRLGLLDLALRGCEVNGSSSMASVTASHTSRLHWGSLDSGISCRNLRPTWRASSMRECGCVSGWCRRGLKYLNPGDFRRVCSVFKCRISSPSTNNSL